MDFGLEGKKALVAGASSGLGRAIAETLIQERATVGICSRDQARIQGTAAKIGATMSYVCDLSLPGAGKKMVEQVAAALGGVDILVMNTGGPPKGTFAEVTDEQWRSSFQNLWMSAVDAIQAALPLMKKGRFGRILLITSVAAKEPMGALTISNGLRAGLSGLAKSLSQEVARDGITVNCLLPGYTDTERLRELGIPPDKIAAQVPAGRLGKPEELGALAAFLCSRQAGYITGQVIAVDGGYLKAH
jgi:3-oxoacyl-[acyl-carrier protein] reductase